MNEQVRIVNEIRYNLGCLKDDVRAAKLWHLIGILMDAVMSETRDECRIGDDNVDYPEAIFEFEERD